MRLTAATVLVPIILTVPLLAACDAPPPDPGAGGGSGAAASCVGPFIDDQGPDGPYGQPAPTVAPGSTVHLHGHWYTSTCNDAGQDDVLRPLPDVPVTVAWPDGESTELGPFTPAGPDMGFDASVDVPAGTPPGLVRVSDGRGGPPYRFRVERGAAGVGG